MPSVAELDALRPVEAANLLRSCCGAARWVTAMVERRPYRRLEYLLHTADTVATILGRDDWLEAFAHHPRIGESKSAATQSDIAQAWSAGEQAAMSDAATPVRAALAAANAEYEQRFGFVCIICATGKSPDELLAITRSRLGNGSNRELVIAAGEQRKITRLRLEKMFNDSTGAPS